MPELPEVEAVRLGIEQLFTDRRILSVQVYDPRSLKRHSCGTDAAGLEDFSQTLTGMTLGRPQRRGKFLWIPLETEPGAHPYVTVENARPVLLAHLGMSGQLLAHDLNPRDTPLRHERIRLDTGPSAPDIADAPHRMLSFHDQRLFGSLAVDELVPDPFATGAYPEGVPSQAAHIAPDPLETGVDVHGLARSIRRHHSAIKRVLLTQTVISGIGNIYADESLWSARIHPEQSADSLSQRRALTLVEAVIETLRRAVAAGGTSFDEQYRHVNGQSGYFAIELKAYAQGGRPCARCGRPIRRVSFMNRHSHFCGYCQRLRATERGTP